METESIDKQSEKAHVCLNVPNKIPDDKTEELAVGATSVNPNTKERIAKVLDEILEAADLKNHYSVKIMISANNVTKVLQTDKDFRKHIVVTADGLPYKVMIELIENAHTCAKCGVKLLHIGDLTEHMDKTQHCEFFQTYGNILPNIGYFHYALTMLRSLVKLEWNIDYQELCKAIHFETEKALFMQLKVTDFRKSLDTRRTVRTAKVRELVTPFVKYAKELDIKVDRQNFLMWKNFHVKSDSYYTVFDIEKYFVTSFLFV